MQDNFKRSKKNEIYCEMDKSESQKCKPKKDKMDQRESQKCKIFHKSKKRQNPFQIAKMQDIFQNQIDKIKKEINLLRNKLERSKKRQSLLEKRESLLENGLTQIAKMQNL